MNTANYMNSCRRPCCDKKRRTYSKYCSDECYTENVCDSPRDRIDQVDSEITDIEFLYAYKKCGTKKRTLRMLGVGNTRRWTRRIRRLEEEGLLVFDSSRQGYVLSQDAENLVTHLR